MYPTIRSTLRAACKRFVQDETGATAIEYGLIGAAVGLTLVAVMPAFNQATNDTYQQILGYFSA